MSDHLEVERTWTPAPGAAVPDLRGVAGVVTVDDPVTHRLEAVYVDTPLHDLVNAGVTLRRRRGGDDEGWHLKLPVPGGRQEVHAPLGDDGVDPPGRLVERVRSLVAGSSLGAIATIVTERTTYVARDATGGAVVLLVDDEVVGTAVDDGAVPVTWREWEVELAAAGEPDRDIALLDEVGGALAAAGAHPAEVGRKIAVVLGHRLDDAR